MTPQGSGHAAARSVPRTTHSSPGSTCLSISCLCLLLFHHGALGCGTRTLHTNLQVHAEPLPGVPFFRYGTPGHGTRAPHTIHLRVLHAQPFLSGVHFFRHCTSVCRAPSLHTVHLQVYYTCTALPRWCSPFLFWWLWPQDTYTIPVRYSHKTHLRLFMFNHCTRHQAAGQVTSHS